MEYEKKVVPTVALRGLTLLPHMIIHFDVSRKKSVNAVEQAMGQDGILFLITQKKAETDDPSQNELFRVGVLASIRQVIKMPDSVLRVLVEVKERARLLSLKEDAVENEQSCLLAEIETAPVNGFRKDEKWQQAALRNLMDDCREFPELDIKSKREMLGEMQEKQDLWKAIHMLVAKIPMTQAQRQQLLDLDEMEQWYYTLAEILQDEIEIGRIKADLQGKLKGKINKNQKEYVLREQMRLIHEELDEDENEDIADYRKALKTLSASKEVKERIRKEIDRLKSISPNSSESTVSRDYIETLLSMPWDKTSEDNTDLKKAMEILEKDHFGLEKVKERVVETLAVRLLTGKGNGTILCLVGPPGTGKTSIAQSVARALNKEYVRICLGGVRDEAEIRGHRKTYVGSMPGRIAVGIRQAGVSNPLMVLDEIDKVGSDFKGDPSAALLEVLDSEQNSHFRDHYLEIPLNLSQVFFLATANDISGIPRPLVDRMEIIEVSGYTENEKLHIGQGYLLPKELKKNGLTKSQLAISTAAMERVISRYTREAGVRGLERNIEKLCRKAAKRLLEGEKTPIRISGRNLQEFLGVEKYRQSETAKKNQIGIVRGLAWTSVGGVTLEIEVNTLPGKGEMVLTGKMGDVMKESARIGMSYVRSVAGKYKVKPEFFKEHDFHIHIPEGAVPKDGPSAGITMALALLSAASGKKVRWDIAMTGEVTLRGRVLPVGGLKEKILAAKQLGIKDILVPKENEKDIFEISDEIKEGLTIKYVETMEEVIKEAFVNGN